MRTHGRFMQRRNLKPMRSLVNSREKGAMMRICAGLFGFLLLVSGCAGAAKIDESWEQDVLAAEARHLAAFDSGDAAAIEALFAEDFLVNSPRYVVLDKKGLMDLVHGGQLNSSSFTQDIEKIRRYGDIAVVMGADAIVFAPPAANAGQTIRRRFTDIWRLQNGEWQFVARHANPVCN
jgi:ketosteroid isomerase-like protein